MHLQISKGGKFRQVTFYARTMHDPVNIVL